MTKRQLNEFVVWMKKHDSLQKRIGPFDIQRRYESGRGINNKILLHNIQVFVDIPVEVERTELDGQWLRVSKIYEGLEFHLLLTEQEQQVYQELTR